MLQVQEVGVTRGKGSPPSDRPRLRDRRSRAGNGSGTVADEAIGRALGWLSIGLGLTEIAAPRGLARFLGVGERDGLIRSLGIRELASGIGILAQRRPVGWLWSRVGGDVMDVAVLLAALKASAKPGRVLGRRARSCGRAGCASSRRMPVDRRGPADRCRREHPARARGRERLW